MNIYTLNRKALSMCLMVAVFATYSLNAFATPPKTAGEIIVSGKALGETTSVKVNGNSVENGSSIFSTSSIKTTDSEAVVNVGKIGRVQLSPSTDLKLTFDKSNFSGDLTQGKVMVLSASEAEKVETTFNIPGVGSLRLAPNTSASFAVTKNGLNVELQAGELTSTGTVRDIMVTLPDGKNVNLTTGATVNAAQSGCSGSNGNCGKAGAAWMWWALLFGGALAGILYAASQKDELDLGGGGTVISPSS